ncbi:hypothetical protein [Tomitella fengzijianii]|uniref:Head-to-tail adaptor n=1 Tax=Tomitella fengzijianii TaxID=2597660 RepID=A0A516X4I9_9ACTN|nr:hypothetical protein [Tomitella fengzijianii]QDQ97977.1 hypothetical protein FO059_12450 [Tomitella fengzijianii]
MTEPAAELPPIISADELADLTGGEVDADDHTRRQLAAITTAIRNRCGWHIAPVITEDLTLDGPGGYDLALPTLRLEDIEQITDAGTTIESPEWSRLGNVRKPDRRPWSTRYQGITATIRHGFDAPADLALLIAELVAQAVNAPAGTASATEKFGPFSFTGAAATPGATFAIGGASLLAAQSAVLDRYRLEVEP